MFSFFKKKKIISHLRLSGVIGNVGKFKQGMDFSGQEEIIKKAFSLKKASAIAVTINSPGGSPVQCALISERIIQLSKKHDVPVYSFIEDIAASGGYWLACSADKIYVMPSSILGSIGVISAGFGFVEIIKKLGIERRVYSKGKNKGMLDRIVIFFPFSL